MDMEVLRHSPVRHSALGRAVSAVHRAAKLHLGSPLWVSLGRATAKSKMHIKLNLLFKYCV